MGLKKKAKKVIRPENKWLRYCVNLILIALIFTLGIFVGNGKISFSRNQSQLTPISAGLPNQLNYSSVNEVYQALKNNYYEHLTETQLLNGLKHGLAESTNDPYTEYFTAQEAKSFSDELNNTFSGIGAELSKDSSGDLEVISPINGFPADKAGIKAGDIITSINGQSTTNMSVDSAVNDIRGNPGSKVTLSIVRGGSQALSFTITRENINLPSVTSKTLPGNIGYIQISTFADDTSSLATKYANQLAKAHVKGVILDLRNDPGGLLTAAINVSSLWLPQNTKILDEKRGGEVVQSYYATGGDVLNGIPTVVLINAGSASASEITTGALHDNRAAYVIGQKSFGKGVVQSIICITGQTNSNGTCPSDELKVTIASWYRPDGENINHKGITPDQTVTLSQTQASSSDDTQLNAAEAYLASK